MSERTAARAAGVGAWGSLDCCRDVEAASHQPAAPKAGPMPHVGLGLAFLRHVIATTFLAFGLGSDVRNRLRAGRGSFARRATGSPGERDPAADQRDSAKRRDCPQPARFAKGERV